jgi:hypothetical protein
MGPCIYCEEVLQAERMLVVVDTLLSDDGKEADKIRLLNPLFDRSAPLVGRESLAGSILFALIDNNLLKTSSGGYADTSLHAGPQLASAWTKILSKAGSSFDVWQLSVGRLFPGDTTALFLPAYLDVNSSLVCTSQAVPLCKALLDSEPSRPWTMLLIVLVLASAAPLMAFRYHYGCQDNSANQQDAPAENSVTHQDSSAAQAAHQAIHAQTPAAGTTCAARDGSHSSPSGQCDDNVSKIVQAPQPHRNIATSKRNNRRRCQRRVRKQKNSSHKKSPRKSNKRRD